VASFFLKVWTVLILRCIQSVSLVQSFLIVLEQGCSKIFSMQVTCKMNKSKRSTSSTTICKR